MKKKKQTSKIWQNFSTVIIFKIWIFKLSDIDQGIHKQGLQKVFGVWTSTPDHCQKRIIAPDHYLSACNTGIIGISSGGGGWWYSCHKATNLNAQMATSDAIIADQMRYSYVIISSSEMKMIRVGWLERIRIIEDNYRRALTNQKKLELISNKNSSGTT